MRRTLLLVRLLATLGLTLWLLGTASFPVSAQDDPAAAEEATPPPDAGAVPTEEPAEEPAPATGTLSVLVYLCTTGGEAGTSAVFPEGAFAPDDNCSAGTAVIAIDGGETTEVSGAADFSLDAGVHTIADANTGATLDVELVADGVTTVTVVTYAAAEAAEEPSVEAQAQATTIRLVKHDCAPSIQTADDFQKLDQIGKLTTCPVITRPDNAGPDGAIHGDSAAFDFSFDTGDGDPQTLANATFTAAQVCESDLGLDADGDPNVDLCFDASDYAVTVGGGPITITETTPPKKHRFGAVELPDRDDAAALASVDEEAGQFVIDPSQAGSGDGELVVHVYNFSPRRVSVVLHACPDTVTNLDDFTALGDFTAQLQECPTITLDGDDSPAGAVTGGHAVFDVSVTDAGDVEQTIADATFVPLQVCESDLHVDLDQDASTDLCLDESAYAYDEVAEGTVTVTETALPADRAFGAVEVAPDSGDAAIDPDKVDAANGTVTLDTTGDGEVTLHIFNFVAAQGGDTSGGGDNSGGENNTGGGDDGSDTGGGNSGGDTGGDTGDGSDIGGDSGGTGYVDIYQLYCLGSEEATYIEVLDPGQIVDPYSFGDDTCIEDANEFQITEFSQTDLEPFDVGYDGYEELELPATTGKNPHLITETWSGVTEAFAVEEGTVTEIVVLVYEYDEYADDYGYEDNSYGDETDTGGVEDVVSGDDLPDTGIAVMAGATGLDGGFVLLLGMSGMLVLGGAYRLRRAGSR
jgi:hypothetical protein